MGKGLLGKKLGMIQVFDENRRLVPVTVIEAGPCGIVQVKQAKPDGYEAVQIGFQEIHERKLSKPQIGHLKKAGNRFWRYLKEVQFEGESQVGSLIDVGIFSEGEAIDVLGEGRSRVSLSGIILLVVLPRMVLCFIGLQDL